MLSQELSIAGIGTDLEPIRSFRSRPYAKNRVFYERIFSEAEIAYCRKYKDASSRFATRFCAKEALVKAARPAFALYITDCEIRNRPDGSPYAVARSKRSEVKKFFRTHQIFLSLSHTEDAALAFVVLVGRGKRK